jgi:uncharacterized membrane protein YbhN (UPF0104 family)
LGLLFLWLFLRQIDTGSVLATVARALPAPIVIALVAYATDFLLRAVRFWMLLQAVTGQRLPLSQVPAPFIASFGISDLLPLRAGDVFRLFWFQRRMALPASGVLGAMMIERFFDLFALMLIALAVLGWHVDGAWLVYLVVIAGLCIGLGAVMAGARSLSAHAASARWAWVRGLFAAVQSFGILRSPGLTLRLALLSLVCWLLEAVVLIGSWISLGGEWERWIAPAGAFVTSTLGTLFPGLPGHLGTFELFGLETFDRMGVSADFGAAVLLLAHLILWMPTALFAIGWLALGRSGQAAK